MFLPHAFRLAYFRSPHKLLQVLPWFFTQRQRNPHAHKYATWSNGWHSPELVAPVQYVIIPCGSQLYPPTCRHCVVPSRCCLFSVSEGPDSHVAGGPQQARAKIPGTHADLLLLCSHCKHSRGAEGGSSPWTRKCAQTLLRQGSGRSSSCVHKPLAEIFF